MDTKIDTSVPNSARIWNYWLGGEDNYPVDQEAGDAYQKTAPQERDRMTTLPTREERIDQAVLELLFELTQLAARFNAHICPWGQLASYDADAFAPFTTTHQTRG